MNERKTSGNAEKLKGSLEAIGKLIGDRAVESEGRSERAAGPAPSSGTGPAPDPAQASPKSDAAPKSAR